MVSMMTLVEMPPMVEMHIADEAHLHLGQDLQQVDGQERSQQSSPRQAMSRPMARQKSPAQMTRHLRSFFSPLIWSGAPWS